VTTPPTTFREAENIGLVLGGSADLGRRQLSVAEMQQALRALQAQRPPAAQQPGGLPRRPDEAPRSSARGERRQGRHRREAKDSRTSTQVGGDIEIAQWISRGDNAENADDGGLQTGWIAVVAAHAGAGASTTALAISAAAAGGGRPTHLIEYAPPSRSGLVAAASTELGADANGRWRRGLRSGVIIDRWATSDPPGAWPTLPASDRSRVTVVDLGQTDVSGVALPVGRANAVVVCRPSVPGVRLTEQLLDQLATQPMAIAAIGPSRWPAEVTASLGPRLRALREAGRVVPVPMDRRLAVTGLTPCALSKPVHVAGRALFDLLDPNRRSVAGSSAATARRVPTRDGARR
jgi:hypothetical protein